MKSSTYSYHDTSKTPANIRAQHAKKEREHQKTQALFLSLSTDSKQLLAPKADTTFSSTIHSSS